MKNSDKKEFIVRLTTCRTDASFCSKYRQYLPENQIFYWNIQFLEMNRELNEPLISDQMTASFFNRHYGRIIKDRQDNRSLPRTAYWPYLIPLMGEDTEDDLEIRKNFKRKGIKYDGVTGVFYEQGYNTYMRLSGKDSPAISFEFSGCYMAKMQFKYKWYVFHISTSRDTSLDCKAAWIDFLSTHNQHIQTLVVYNPSKGSGLLMKCATMAYKRKQPTMLACVINENNDAYALIYDKNECRVARNLIFGCFPERADNNIRQCPQILQS